MRVNASRKRRAALRAGVALAAAVASIAVASPPALADAGGETALYVERPASDAEAEGDAQQRTTATSKRTSSEGSPATGDHTTAAPAALAAAGTALGAGGLASRRRSRREKAAAGRDARHLGHGGAAAAHGR